MTPELEELARKAGFPVQSKAWYYWDALEKFAALVQMQAFSDILRVKELSANAGRQQLLR